MLKLKELRRRAVLSTRELADRAGISPATVWRIERGAAGRLRPATMRAIAKALRVDPAEIEEFAGALGVASEPVEQPRPKPRRTRPPGVPSPHAPTARMSESVLARDWLTPEEDEAWAHL